MQPTNFLNMCRIAARMRGIPGAGPSTVVDQTGSLARVVNDIVNAYSDIQEERDDWGFQWAAFEFTTTATDAYSAPFTDDGVDRIKHPLFITTSAIGLASRTPLRFKHWEEFRSQYYGATVNGKPSVYTIHPDNMTIVLRNVPVDDSYVVDGEYYQNTHLLGETSTPNSETTRLTTVENWSIIYRANMMYAEVEEIPDLLKTSQYEFNRRFNQLIMKYVTRNIRIRMRPLA